MAKGNLKKESKKVSKESNPQNLPNLSAPEKTIRLLEYLKKHTDKEHSLKSVKNVQKEFNDKDLHFGSDNTIRDFYRKIANAYNLDEYQHPLPQSQWRIVYDGYVKLYGEDEEGISVEDDSDEWEEDREKFSNLYYVPEFSYEEIDALVEAVQLSRTLSEEETEHIISTLEDKFTSKYYRKGARRVCKINGKGCCDRDTLRKNLLTIQQAIMDGVQVTYRFNGYDRDKKLAPMRDYKRYASPYYIVANDGRYYLMAANEAHKDEGAYIVRIDLMTEVEIPKRNEKSGKKGIPAIPKKEVAGLPSEWDENFSMQHVNMSYGAPISITIRVKNKKKEDGCTPVDPVYTFLHDYFGDTYRFIAVDENDSDYDIVTVTCTSFGMENFAMQYADRVEVLKPLELREKIRNKAQAMAERYGVSPSGL